LRFLLLNDEWMTSSLVIVLFQGKFIEGNGQLLVFLFSPYIHRRANKHHVNKQITIQ